MRVRLIWGSRPVGGIIPLPALKKKKKKNSKEKYPSVFIGFYFRFYVVFFTFPHNCFFHKNAFQLTLQIFQINSFTIEERSYLFICTIHQS